MFYAYNAVGRKVGMDEADPQYTYTCCHCGRPMKVRGTELVKKDGIHRKHFAHPRTKEGEIPCPETIGGNSYHKNDMTEWHKNWQKRFPAENEEIWKKGSEGWVRADVLLPHNMTVIEFQTSPIRREEWERRNRIYKELGYTVIWLFDKIDAIDVEEWDEMSYPGKYGVQFGEYYPQKDREVLVFMQYTDIYADADEGDLTRIRQMQFVTSYIGGRYQIDWSRRVRKSAFVEFCMERRNADRKERKPGTVTEERKPEELSIYDWFRRYPTAEKIKVQSVKDGRQYWIYEKYLPTKRRPVLKGWLIRPNAENRLEDVWYGGEPRWILLNVTE